MGTLISVNTNDQKEFRKLPRPEARLVDDFTPALIDVGAHNLCPGCGEPIAMRSVMEVIAEHGLMQQAIAVFGIGCYTAFSNNLDAEVLQALHGRAPSLATGVKRARPDTVVITIQGDGDMVNEGLQEVVHAAARGESITCVLLNNGVFGETGGHMTATTTLGQRTKNTLDGRDATAPTPRKPAARPTPERTEEHAHLSLDALREYRKALSAEESRVSYWRRILQARLDLLLAGADADSDTLRPVLTDERVGAGRRALVEVTPVDDIPPLPDLAPIG